MLIIAWQKSLKILKIFASNSHTRTEKETYTDGGCYVFHFHVAVLSYSHHSVFPHVVAWTTFTLHLVHRRVGNGKSVVQDWMCVQMSRLMCVCWGHFGWSSLCHMAAWKLRLGFRVEIRLQDRPRVKVKHVVVVIRERLMSIKIPHKHRHARTHKTVWSCVPKVCPSLRWCSETAPLWSHALNLPLR